MPKKCECCRFYLNVTDVSEFCTNVAVGDLPTENHELFPRLNIARESCDREGDGHFVYFTPKDPQAGACFVQITREPVKAMAAGGRA